MWWSTCAVERSVVPTGESSVPVKVIPAACGGVRFLRRCGGPPVFFAPTVRRQLGNAVDVVVFYVHDRDKTSEDAMRERNPPRISLPGSWSKQVRSAMFSEVSSARYATLYARGAAARDTLYIGIVAS